MEILISELDLSVRSRAALAMLGITRVRELTQANETTLMTYEWDAEGRMIAETLSSDYEADGDPDHGTDTSYIYDADGALVTKYVVIDSDGDGVADSVDQCPGYDDNQDSDSDGIADGCDACPNDANNDWISVITIPRSTNVPSFVGAITVTGVATLGDGSTLASSAAPTADAQIANKLYVDNSVSAENLWNRTGGTTLVPAQDSGDGISVGAGAFSGVVTWSGGGSANANTAYTYSQVGHLPLATGGTVSGDITLSGAKLRRAK